MYKISAQVIDCYDDQKMLLDILSYAPEMVKKAKLLSYEQQMEMPDEDFAVVIMTKTGSKIRKYPVNDAEHTWLSCESFKKTAHKLPISAVKVAASNLFASCLYHGVGCDESITKFASDVDSNTVRVDESKDLPLECELMSRILEKQANEVKDNEWGLIVKTASEEKRMYPLNTKSNLESAIRYFSKYASSILPQYKHELANNIVKKAQTFGIDVPEAVAVYSGNEIGNKFASNMLKRMDYVKTDKEKDFIRKVANIGSKFKMEELLSMVGEFDKVAGLDKYWDKGIKNPYVTVLEKVAQSEMPQLPAPTRTPEDKEPMPRDLEAYSKGEASFELVGHLPQEVINKFITQPIETYNSLPDVQKEVIKKGINGLIK